jgi:transposase
LIKELGHNCSAVAPSLVPRKPGDRVKTNRRDALNLAKLLGAGQLVAVWVPDERHEAMRDLVRAREAAHLDYTRNRQQVSSFLLRLGRHYPGKKTWGKAHLKWLTTQKLNNYERRIAFEELLLAVRQPRERVERLEQAIRDSVPEWSLAPVVGAHQALRGIDLISAVVFMSEIGDLSRFESPRQLMAFLGLVPSERSTGDSVIRGGITAIVARDAYSSKRHGAIDIRLGSAKKSRKKSRLCREPSVRSPGRHRHGCAAVTASSPGEASCRQLSPPQ